MLLCVLLETKSGPYVPSLILGKLNWWYPRKSTPIFCGLWESRWGHVYSMYAGFTVFWGNIGGNLCVAEGAEE